MTGNLCPLCGSERQILLSSGLYKCRNCGCGYNTKHKLLDYTDSYFTSDYKKQYGKTYEEDFNHIYSISKKRIDHIKQISKGTNNSILDIGSALGFFLKCASDAGYKRTLGIEISPYASQYSISKFGIETVMNSFSKIEISEKFDVVTSWYFIEHNNDPVQILHKIFSILENGGIFAMTVPSIFGPLFYFNRKEWIEKHPEDHRVDFSPGSAKKVLKRIGFKSIEIKSAGFHPERVFNSKSIFFPIFKKFYFAFSKMFIFSDTIEVYAIK